MGRPPESIVALESGVAVGVYLHLPFCVVRCTYCDFYSLVGQDDLASAYVDALAAEIQAFPSDEGHVPDVASVYIGGGTPTHMPPGSVARLIGALRSSFRLQQDAEITVEANPESATSEALEEIRSAGANRISIGVQSFEASHLALMGRPHGPDAPARVVAAARRAGLDNVSVDLIYGLPGQDLLAWRSDLDRALGLGVDHLSAYLLETDKDTPLAKRLEAGELPEPTAEHIEALFHITEEVLPRHGFARYEISNWSRPGRESRHNLGYWTDRPYIGFGASSHSYFGGVRSACRLSASSYVQTVRAHAPTRTTLDDGSREVRLSEAIVTALRLARGADFDRIGTRYGTDLWSRHARDLEELEPRGWVRVSPPYVALTRQGILWSMEALAPFVGGARAEAAKRAEMGS